MRTAEPAVSVRRSGHGWMIAQENLTIVPDRTSLEFSKVHGLSVYWHSPLMSGYFGGQQTMRKRLFGVILAVLAPASLQGQSVNPADSAATLSPAVTQT